MRSKPNRGRIAYSLEQKAEAIALYGMIGAVAAAEQLGMDPRAIRKWSLAAGVRSTDYLEPTTWQRIHDASIARVDALIGTGRMTAVQLATVAAIATRNLSAPAERPVAPAVQAREAFDEWLVERTVAGAVDPDAYVAAFDQMAPELLRCANAERDQPHRPALLAWFNGRADVPAMDLLEWAQAQTDALLAEHGSLEGVAASIEARREAYRVAWQTQIATNRAKVEEMRRAAEDALAAASLAALPPEVRALLDEGQTPLSGPRAMTALPPITEREFMRQVLDLAGILGWSVYHPALSKWSERGWPDLAMVRPPRFVLAELKRENGKTSEHQDRWLGMLGQCPGIETYLWRPSDLDAIAGILR